MSKLNVLLASRFNEGLDRLLGIEGDIGIESLGTDLMAELSLQSDRPEWAVLFNEIPWMIPIGLAASPGNFGEIGVTYTNPNSLVVVKKVIIINGTAGVLGYRVAMATNAGLVTTAGAVSRDLRRSNPPVIGIANTNAGGIIPGAQPLQVGPNSNFTLDVDWMLSATKAFPTVSLIVESSIVNQGVNGYFFGYVRGLRPEEVELGG